MDIRAEDGATIDLGRTIQTCLGGAEQFELFRLLEKHGIRNRQLRGGGGQFAIAQVPASLIMDHAAVFRMAVLGGHTPGLCRSRDEDLAAHRAGFTQ